MRRFICFSFLLLYKISISKMFTTIHHAIHRFDFYLFILHLLWSIDACFWRLAVLKKSNHSQSIMVKITFSPSVCRRHPTIAIKDQTITIRTTSRSDFCCSRLATGLAVRETFYLFSQLNGGLNLKSSAKWISSSSTRQRSAFQFISGTR